MELEAEEEGTGRPGCRSKYWANEDPDGEELKGTGRHVQFVKDDAEVFSKIREDRRDGSNEDREDRDDGIVERSTRKTCNRVEKTDGTTNVNRYNKCDVLKSDKT